MAHKKLFFALLFLIQQSVFAAEIRRGPGGENSNLRFSRGELPSHRLERESSERPPSREGTSTIVRSSSGEVAKCEDGNTLPLSLLKLITENGNGIEITHNLTNLNIPKDQKRVTVDIPSYLGNCADLSPKIFQDEKQNLLSVTVENNFPIDDYLLGLGEFKDKGPRKKIKGLGMINSNGKNYTADDLKKMNAVEKFEACMTLEGLLSMNDNNQPELKWPEVKGYKESNSQSFNIDFNPNKDLKVIFASPREGARAYGPAFSYDENSTVAFNNATKCLKREEIIRGGVYLWDEVDRKYAKLQEDCLGSHHRIKDALARIGEFPEKDLFRKILEKQLQNELNEMAQDRFKRMEDLSKKMLDPKTGRDEMEKYSGEYISFVRELDNFYVKNKIDELEKYTKKRSSANVSEKEKKEIDLEILRLNKEISQYSSGEVSKKLNSTKVLEKLRENGLVDEANEIAEFKLKSLYFGRVYFYPIKPDERGNSMTFQEAEKKLRKDSTKYRKDSELFSKVYMSKTGQGKFSTDYAKKMQGSQARIQAAYASYQAEEQKAMSYCQITMIGSVQNSVKCKQLMSPEARQRRMRTLQAKVNAYQGKMTQDHEIYKKLFALESEAAKIKKPKPDDDGSREGDDGFEDFLGNSSPFDIENINDSIIADDKSGNSMLANPQGGRNPSSGYPGISPQMGNYNLYQGRGNPPMLNQSMVPYGSAGGYNMYSSPGIQNPGLGGGFNFGNRY